MSSLVMPFPSSLITSLGESVCSPANRISAFLACASKAFFTNSKTATKSLVISSRPMIVLRAELTRNLSFGLPIGENLLQGQTSQFGKQRRNRVAYLCVAGNFLRAAVSARSVFPLEVKIIRKRLDTRTFASRHDSWFRVMYVIIR